MAPARAVTDLIMDRHRVSADRVSGSGARSTV